MKINGNHYNAATEYAKAPDKHGDKAHKHHGYKHGGGAEVYRQDSYTHSGPEVNPGIYEKPAPHSEPAKTTKPDAAPDQPGTAGKKLAEMISKQAVDALDGFFTEHGIEENWTELAFEKLGHFIEEGYGAGTALVGLGKNAVSSVSWINETIPMTHEFGKGTLEKFMFDSLDGKVKDAAGVSLKMNSMIRASFGDGKTVEERAEQRETALRHAGYIAENYFNNPDEAKAFLDEVNRFAENDVLREKGYAVFDNSDMAPVRPHESSVSPDRAISTAAYAKHAGYGNLRDILEDPKLTHQFFHDLSRNQAKWGKEITEGFEENEARIDDIISKVKNTLDGDKVVASLSTLMDLLGSL